MLLAAEAQKWDLELARFAGFSCGLKERKTWPLWFAPFQVAEIWPEWMTGGLRGVGLEEGDEQSARMARSILKPFSQLK